MKAIDKNLLIMLFVPTKDGLGAIGTGYPISENLILTARHVLEPDDRNTCKKIRVCWNYFRSNENQGWFDISDDDIVWRSENGLDAALIRCSKPTEVKGFGVLSSELPCDNTDWASEGFPRVTKCCDTRNPASFIGKVCSKATQETYFELTVESHPNKENDWKGASGMPVFVGDKIIGVVQSVPANFDGSRLHATPIWKLLEDKKFCSLIGYINPEINAVCRFLEAIKKECNWFKPAHVQKRLPLKQQHIDAMVIKDELSSNQAKSRFEFSGNKPDVVQIYSLWERGNSDKAELNNNQNNPMLWQDAKKDPQQKDFQRLIILADPGMGKSTLLRMEAVNIAEQELAKLSEEQECYFGASLIPQLLDDILFPLYLRLSELADVEKELISTIPELINKCYAAAFKGLEVLLAKKLTSGQCLLLLDGMDEVPVDKRVNLEERLQRFAQNYANKIYLSSRITGYSRVDIGDSKELKIMPFNHKQIEEYIAAWFINTAEHLSDDTISAVKLIEELEKKPQIHGLAQSPLVLSMICSLYQVKGLTLPTRRSLLYEEVVQNMLLEWRKDRSHGKNPPDRVWANAKKELLGWIAYEMTCKGILAISINEFSNFIDTFLYDTKKSDFRDKKASMLINELAVEDGIFCKPSEKADSYLFLHRTFQEYFTARYMSSHQNGIELAKKHVWAFEWHEIITLMAEILVEPIALIQAIVEEEDDIFKTQLLLAGQCLIQLPKIPNPLIEEVITRIYGFWEKFPTLDFVQRVVMSLGQSEATSPIILKIISKQLKKAAMVADDHDFWKQGETIKLLIALGSPEALAIAVDNFPIKADRKGYGLENVTAEQAVKTLIYAPQHAVKIFDFFNYEIFFTGSMDERLRSQLNRLNDGVFVALAQAFKHEDYRIREDVASRSFHKLAELGISKTIPLLIDVLKNNPYDDARWKAAEALAEFRVLSLRSIFIPAFREALTDHYWLVRKQAVSALIGLHDVDYISKLISLTKEDNEISDYFLLDTLENLYTPEAIIAYRNCLVDVDEFVRTVAAQTLEKIAKYTILNKDEFNVPKDLNYFLVLLKDDNELVRMIAARALAKIGTAEVVDNLRLALRDSNKEVQQYAAEALGNIGNDAAISCLCEVLGDDASDFNLAVVDALRNIGSSNAIESLNNIFCTADNNAIRFHAAAGLAKTGNSEAINYLVDMGYEAIVSKLGNFLGKCKNDFRLAVVKAFGQITKTEPVPDIKPVTDELRNIEDSSTRDLHIIESLYDIFCTADNDTIRFHAAEVLATAGYTEPDNVTSPDQFDWKIIMEAVSQSLAEQDTPEAVLALCKMLNAVYYIHDCRIYKDEEIAAKAVSDICIRASIGTLLDICSQKLSDLEHHNEFLRHTFKEAINEKCHDQPECILDIIDTGCGSNHCVDFLVRMMLICGWHRDIDFSKISLSKAKPILLKAANNTSPNIRQIAAELMGKIKCLEFEAALVKALSPNCTSESSEAFQATKTEIATAAAKSLSQYASQSAITALVNVIIDENSSIRKSSVDALVEMKIPKAATALAETIERINEDEIRQYALDAFLKTPDASEKYPSYAVVKQVHWGSKDIPRLIEEFRQEEGHNEGGYPGSNSIQSRICETLGEINHPDAISFLIDLLTLNCWRNVKEAAVRALGKSGNFTPKIVTALLKLVASVLNGYYDHYGRPRDADVGRAAANVLQQVRNPEAIPALELAIHDDDIEIQRRAVIILGQIGTPKAIGLLRQVIREYCLKKGNFILAEKAALMLGNLRETEAIPEIVSLVPKSAFGNAAEPNLKIILKALENIGTIEVLEKLIQLPAGVVYSYTTFPLRYNIFILMRSLMIRYQDANVKFIPVRHPELIG